MPPVESSRDTQANVFIPSGSNVSCKGVRKAEQHMKARQDPTSHPDWAVKTGVQRWIPTSPLHVWMRAVSRAWPDGHTWGILQLLSGGEQADWVCSTSHSLLQSLLVIKADELNVTSSPAVTSSPSPLLMDSSILSPHVSIFTWIPRCRLIFRE